ncbi:glycosyltransferase family protein [Fundidesulfovibrio terrae]|uniref:glycosyltransferase family protein n=1 Tax=Fundidesulfovibrio terrae TaxID=2922866 RepID=UPI001FAE9EDA|nr:glycosyltransferase [Fundidesulfovibrio terrae]
MNIVFYCQHVLGLGHFMRSLAIVRALAPHRTVFVTGGPEVPGELPPHVVHERLPVLSMDEDFREMLSGDDLDAVKRERAARFAAVMERERPDVLVVELYPFGRRAFEFELLPVLDAVRRGAYGRPRVVCSLRDILVEKDNPEKYQSRVVGRLNQLFDALLVHSDPALFPLEETFPRIAEAQIPVEYTGFVTQMPSPGAREAVRASMDLAPGERLVVASAGGGKVGSELLFAAVNSYPLLITDNPVRLEIFTGPFLDEEAYQRLLAHSSAHERVFVSRFSGNFLDLLAAADASLSLAGYNTTMNVLASGVPALVWPFAQNREQSLRAHRLAGLGALGVLSPEDFEPARLAGLVGGLLDRREKALAGSFRLDGAAESARLIVSGMRPNRQQHQTEHP